MHWSEVIDKKRKRHIEKKIDKYKIRFYIKTIKKHTNDGEKVCNIAQLQFFN